MIRVADYVANFVWELGVREVFLVTGGGAMFLDDAIAGHGKLKYVCCHHEQAVAMAVDAYARQNENFGVAVVTSGPGSTNTLTGVLSAWQDSTPCMFISGQSKRVETTHNAKIPGLRQFGILEVDIIPIVSSITKYAVMINDPQKIRYYLEKATHIAKGGRPGPVWLDIPLDVQGALIDPGALEGFTPPKETMPDAAASIQQAALMLKAAKRPVIIAGNGVRLSKVIPAFMRFIEKIGLPVVVSYLAIDLMETDNPLYVGRVGSKGQRAANFAVQNADLILAVGTSLSVSLIGHEYDLFAPKAKKIVVDIEPAETQKKIIKIDLFIQSDAAAFFERLSEDCAKQSVSVPGEWKDACRTWKEKYPVVLAEYAAQTPINSYYFIDELSKKSEPGDIISCDAGTSFHVTAQSVRIKNGQRYITPGSVGTMGYSLPASIGASVAGGGKRVLCITGEGSLQMNLQELQTIVQNNLPVKIFVINNGGYKSIRMSQLRYFKRLIGEGKDSGISFPDTEKIALAYGIRFSRVSKPQELAAVIGATLNSGGPAICEVMCAPEQDVAPVVGAEKRDDGTMVSKPLHDMYPYLDRDVLKKEMRFSEGE